MTSDTLLESSLRDLHKYINETCYAYCALVRVLQHVYHSAGLNASGTLGLQYERLSGFFLDRSIDLT